MADAESLAPYVAFFVCDTFVEPIRLEADYELWARAEALRLLASLKRPVTMKVLNRHGDLIFSRELSGGGSVEQ